jgi:para-nitrobenzyl esterase
VQANIARFGGDPENVRVFGESAGAHAIGILMASPLARGLMHKAIGQSGAFWDTPHGSLTTYAEARARGAAFAAKLGAQTIADLRALPAETVNAAAPWDFESDPGLTPFSPSIDGYVVPDVPAARVTRGEQLPIPLLAGWNAVENWPFRDLALPHATAAAFRTAAEQLFGADRMSEFLAHYPAATDEEATASAYTLAGDMLISQQVWEWLELHARLPAVPVYGYTFSYTSPYVPIASHVVDVASVFGTLTPQFIVNGAMPPGAADRALAATMMTAWVNFAAHGDPNGAGVPSWAGYRAAGQVQSFDTTVETRDCAEAERFRFLSSFRTAGVLPSSWRDASA